MANLEVLNIEEMIEALRNLNPEVKFSVGLSGEIISSIPAGDLYLPKPYWLLERIRRKGGRYGEQFVFYYITCKNKTGLYNEYKVVLA